MRHLDLKEMLLKEKVESKEIKLLKVASADNTSDIGTTRNFRKKRWQSGNELSPGTKNATERLLIHIDLNISIIGAGA